MFLAAGEDAVVCGARQLLRWWLQAPQVQGSPAVAARHAFLLQRQKAAVIRHAAAAAAARLAQACYCSEGAIPSEKHQLPTTTGKHPAFISP